MMPILYAIAVLLFSINLILGLPKIVDLTQTKVSASNLPNNQVFTVQAPGEVVGIKKINLSPVSNNIPVPSLSAISVLIKDLDSNTVLWEKDSHKRVPIASTTKIMTALVAAEHFKPNDVLIASESAMVEGSSMGLKLGESLSLRSLLYGMLLNSGNDAAFAIAGNFPGGVSAFVDAMNQKARELDLIDTHFDNPAGFDGPNHFSSAADLAKIAAIAAENSQLSRVVSTKETTVSSIDKVTVHPLKNLNRLLGIPGVMGMKTGFTPQAKENLVGLVMRNDHKILTVVLGSDDRFGETEKLIEWTFNNFSWQ